MATMTATRRKKGAPSWAFHSCRDMLLSAFITCLVDKDLSVLGGPDDARADKWEQIRLEYYDLCGGEGLSATMYQVKDAQKLAALIGRVSATADLLRQFWHPIHVSELKIDYPALKSLQCRNKEETPAFLEKVDALLKRDLMRLKNLREDMKPKKGKKEAEPTYEDFASNCVEVSKFMGYNIDPEGTTVMKYCLCLSRLNKHIESVNRQIEQQQNGAGNGR